VYVCADDRQVAVCVAMHFKYRLQCMLSGDFTWCAVWYWWFCVRQRRAFHQS